MATSDDFEFTLPYFSDDLPGPLRTQKQIENSDQNLVEVRVRKVVRVGERISSSTVRALKKSKQPP